MTLETQFFTLAMMSLSGLTLSVLFDLYRVLSGQFRIKRWTKSLIDVLYWLIATIFVFEILYYSNSGQIRFFIFLGLLIGVWTYFMLFSSFVIRAILWSIRVLKYVIKFFIRTLELIIVRPIRFLIRVLIIIFGFIIAFAMFINNIMVQLLNPIYRLLKWLLEPLLRKWTPRWLIKFWKKAIWWVRKRFKSDV